MEDNVFLKKTALKTWNYFSDNSLKHTNFLPPDNIQVFSKNKIAPYTSISNIGFYLISCYTAYELKFITLGELIERSQAVIESLVKMERFRGHFYNWYDLKTLRASRPMYVSTVDSGNLMAVFVVLTEGFRLIDKEYEFNDMLLEGLITHLELISEYSSEFDKYFSKKFQEIRNELKTEVKNIGKLVEFFHKITLLVTNAVSASKNLSQSIKKEAARLYDLHQAILYELEAFYPDKPEHVHDELLEVIERIDSSQNLLELEENILLAINHLNRQESVDQNYFDRLKKSYEYIQDKKKRIITMADWFEAVFKDIDFSFLYNKKLKALSIGYKSIQKKAEKYHYQTLASESRLAVFLAIAKNNISFEAWSGLNRHTRQGKKGPFIVSWSGTMFEYFMPDIFMKCASNSIYIQTYLNYLEEQKEFSRKKGIPWGLSESCYYSFNKDKEYKYKAFGIASAALDPNVNEKPVVSAYSTFLAMRHDLKGALENLKRIAKDGGTGEYGFFESIDYSSGEPKVVRTYMSHHQGMILGSLCNILKDNKLIKLFHLNIEVKSIEYVLEENKSGPVTLPEIDIQNKENLIYK